MPNQTTYPLIFNCHKCKKESSYPNLMKEGAEKDGATTVIKRCTTCGEENKVELPEGWVGIRTDTLLRGLPK
ncbi:MAG: hypothetical protein R2788_08220 [Saprospiraceae bacterium]